MLNQAQVINLQGPNLQNRYPNNIPSSPVRSGTSPPHFIERRNIVTAAYSPSNQRNVSPPSPNQYIRLRMQPQARNISPIYNKSTSPNLSPINKASPGPNIVRFGANTHAGANAYMINQPMANTPPHYYVHGQPSPVNRQYSRYPYDQNIQNGQIAQQRFFTQNLQGHPHHRINPHHNIHHIHGKVGEFQHQSRELTQRVSQPQILEQSCLEKSFLAFWAIIVILAFIVGIFFYIISISDSSKQAVQSDLQQQHNEASITIFQAKFIMQSDQFDPQRQNSNIFDENEQKINPQHKLQDSESSIKMKQQGQKYFSTNQFTKMPPESHILVRNFND